MYEEILVKAGLTAREVAVYTVLRTQGEMMASLIARKSGMIRTNAYDVLNSLIKKGIVSSVNRSGRRYFHAAEPERLIDYIDSREKDLEELKQEIAEILPNLRPLAKGIERPRIEIYEGREGLKTVLEMSVRESLRTGKEILGISVQQEKCRMLAGPYHIRWYNERARHRIRSRYLMSVEEKIILVKYTQFKVLPSEAKNPNEVFIFGNITSHFYFTGDLFTAIIIESEDITNKYRDYFEFLWKMIK